MFWRSIILTSILMFLVSVANAGVFCACCAEPGTYMISTGRPDAFQIDILKQIEFGKKASLFITEAGFESIKGLTSIQKEFDDPVWDEADGDFDLANAFNGKYWTFSFRTPNGKKGTIRLPMPTRMLAFKADIHDENGRPNGPLLYKEFRFKGIVSSGSGFLSSGIVNPTTYFLVFQGRGNGCDEVSDFRNWNLEITGRKARYQFYGNLENDSDNSAVLQPKKQERPISLLTLQ